MACWTAGSTSGSNPWEGSTPRRLWCKTAKRRWKDSCGFGTNWCTPTTLLRFTLFQRAKIQPFAEGFVGARGSLLGARFTAQGSDDFTPVNDVPFFSANFSYGYALGARVQMGERTFLTARYGEMRHLDGGNVVEVADADRLTFGPDGTVTSNATTGLTLPPYSVRVGLAMNF